jgi:hypothetical protein
MAKGQAEIAVIVGIVIVAAVVVIYAIPNIIPSGVPAGVKAKYDSVEASFEGLVLAGSQDTMTRLSTNGGYPDNQSFLLDSVKFLGKDVPYWQNGGQVKYPDVKANFDAGLRDYITRNKDTILQASGMAGVEFGQHQVSTKFFDDKIVVTVNMPTTIDGQRISQPYVVEVQSRLSQINDFAKGFSQYDSSQRPLEYFTISSIVLSPIEEDSHIVPTYVHLTQCGEYVFKSWWDVKPAMEDTVRKTLANTYMPGKAPENFMMNSPSPKYTLVPISGKRYESLDVNFFLPDEFSLDQSNFQFTPDPISATSNIIPMVGACMSDPVYVKYYISYPAIVRVKDPLTQNVFQFALDVYIKDNVPGQWASQGGYQDDAQKQICSNYQCVGDFLVKDSSGMPVESVDILFMGCDLGRTGSDGRLRTAAPCGIGPLQVYHPSYTTPIRMESSDNISGLTISVVKKPNIRLHFYEVTVQNLSLTKEYRINKADVSVLDENRNVYMNFYDVSGSKSYERGFGIMASSVSNMPAGLYVIGAVLYSKDKDAQGISRLTELGGIMLDYTLSKDLDGKDLYVYLPKAIEYRQLTDDSQKAYSMMLLSSILNKCGLGPLNETVSSFNGCTVGYDAV